jgi:CO/xanthine dehydrogenase FAD-binding subunit
MISEYHRPQTLEAALALLQRAEPPTVPLAGGSSLNRPRSDSLAVVDLQALGLGGITEAGPTLELGATTTLAELLAYLAAHAAPWSDTLAAAIRREATHNLRQVATVAGTLLAADGRSPFTALLLALDAQLVVQPGGETLPLSEVLPFRRERLRGRLVTQVRLPREIASGWEAVARTPADQPIVLVAVAQWPAPRGRAHGRLRLVVGGFGAAPALAFDAPEPNGAESAAASACHAAEDEWASAAYREAIAPIFTRRLLAAL